MRHTWEFVRRSRQMDHPLFFELECDALIKWASVRGIFRSRQTGETTHKKIKIKR